MLYSLEDYGKDIIVVANKIDKIKQTVYEEQFEMIKELIGIHKIIPYSAKKKIGVSELLREIFI
jgi:GTP-binding protein EngB required for normal cell division